MARILVVEDSLTIVSAVESMLRQAGHEVYTARDGLKALASLRAFHPQVIFLDILLPYTDGFEICASIRRNPAHEGVRVVMMTSLTDDGSVQHAYAVGADGYIKKPFTEAQLISEIGLPLPGKLSHLPFASVGTAT
jgi:DNA-binding response OmpR family regulator